MLVYAVFGVVAVVQATDPHVIRIVVGNDTGHRHEVNPFASTDDERIHCKILKYADLVNKY